jgi:hypothetical protein
MKILVKQSEKKVLTYLLRAGTYIWSPLSITRTYSVKQFGKTVPLIEFMESTYKRLKANGYIDEKNALTELGKQAAISKWLEIPDKEAGENG